MSLDKAIESVDHKLHTKLENAIKNENADAATLLKMVKGWRAGTIFLRIVLSILSFGILPLIYYRSTLTQNIKCNVDNSPNWITDPWHSTRKAIIKLNKIANAKPAENKDNDNSQDPDEHKDSQDEPSSSTSEKTRFKKVEETTGTHLKDLEKNDNNKSASKEENAALRKFHSASKSKDKSDQTAKTQGRLSSTILSTGDIVVCDKAISSDAKERFILSIIPGQDGLPTDMPIIKHLFSTPNPKAAQFVPFHKKGTLVFFVRDGNKLTVLNADGQPIINYPYPDENSQLLIPLDYETENDLTTASVIEFSNNEKNCDLKCILLHTMRSDNHGNIRRLGFTDDPVTAATYDHTNNVIFFIAGTQLKGINVKTDQSCTTWVESLNNVSHMAISENGHYLATTKADGTVIIYASQAFYNLNGSIKQLSSYKIDEGVIPLDIRFLEGDKDLLITTDVEDMRIDNFAEDFDKTARSNLK